MGQNYCKVDVTVTNPGDLTPNEIQEYANTFRECTLRQYRQVCWPASYGDETPNIPWCRSPLNLENLTPPKKHGDRVYVNLGQRACSHNKPPICNDFMYLPAARPCGSAYGAGAPDGRAPVLPPFEDCRFKQNDFYEYTMRLSRHSTRKTEPDHGDMSEGEWVEAMMSCHVPPAGSNDDRPFCRHYLRSEYLTLVEEYSINAEDFTGLFDFTPNPTPTDLNIGFKLKDRSHRYLKSGLGSPTHQEDTPTHTHQERHAFAILAVATARDVQQQQQEDPKSDDDTERTNAVLARAEAALACTQMWEDANFDLATARTACPEIFPTPNCDDVETMVYRGKTCAWITKKNDPSNQKKKCNKSSDSFLHIGKKVYDVCPSTCAIVDLGPCRQFN